MVSGKTKKKLKGDKDEKGSFVSGGSVRSSNVGIVLNPRKAGEEKAYITAEETQHIINATYKDMKKPCPECGGIQIEFTRGDGLIRHWCRTPECWYLEPRFARERDKNNKR